MRHNTISTRSVRLKPFQNPADGAITLLINYLINRLTLQRYSFIANKPILVGEFKAILKRHFLWWLLLFCIFEKEVKSED